MKKPEHPRQKSPSVGSRSLAGHPPPLPPQPVSCDTFISCIQQFRAAPTNADGLRPSFWGRVGCYASLPMLNILSPPESFQISIVSLERSQISEFRAPNHDRQARTAGLDDRGACSSDDARRVITCAELQLIMHAIHQQSAAAAYRETGER